MTATTAQRVRLYRLWRTSGILMALGTAEFALLAWQRRLPWLWAVVVGLAAGTGAALQRAAVQRRQLQGTAGRIANSGRGP
jgi:hypothetical protein